MGQKIKLNSRQAEPKAKKVTFKDEVMQINIANSEPSETPLAEEVLENLRNEEKDQSLDWESYSESDSESDSESSETDQSTEEEQEESTTATANDNVVLTPDQADLILSYLDQMSIRTLRTECASARLMKEHIAGAQARLDQAKNMLDNIPQTMPHTERKVYMLEICQYVESIFNSLEKLSIKLVKCHGDSVSDIIKEFDDNLKTIEDKAPKPVRRRVHKEGVRMICWLFAVMVLSYLLLTLDTK